MARTLLICAQTVDSDDPMLGFFHRWIEEFASRADSVEVICLQAGKYSFPDNVRVHSLGKERNPGPAGSFAARMTYAARALSLFWRLRRRYGTVFVHMNQEYPIIAGWLCRLLGKRLYLWRNHYAGSWRTDLAASFCTGVFCTSTHSYTARYAKTVLMPVGVDTKLFAPAADEAREKGSILLLGRIDPSKRLEVFVDALGMLRTMAEGWRATLAGPAVPAYVEQLKERAESAGIGGLLSFQDGVPHGAVPGLMGSYEIAVNCAPAGMYDKTIFEAAACGCIVIASSPDFAALAGAEYSFPEGDVRALAERLAAVLALRDKEAARQDLAARVVAPESLTALMDRLAAAIY